MHVEYFQHMSVLPPKERIYIRLGYSKGKTQLTAQQRSKVERYIEDTVCFIDLKGAAARLNIVEIKSPRIKLAEHITLHSRGLAEMLKNCSQALLMGVTAGEDIIKAVGKETTGGNVTAGVVFDAVASEIVDEGLTWIKKYFNHQLRRENRQVTKKRLSAGYGDFLLDNQKIICDKLQLSRFGVKLTDSYMLTPEKSVTAVAGIKSIITGNDNK